ncbi:hypothetical protein CTEN210_14077 [Chaetoceros tenuissimus]|uniref:Uncharacterized protein n=1 Tax=Chaetoceros tenuissimus TaxID=426638 RepID=A0AAD3HBX1_9STRA|nr:hypothetical protein CTEN210_14077 [Chaetoceros tenuissimus]
MEDRDSTSKARKNSVNIGGSKGHVEECVTDENFCKIFLYFRWKMIRNCTGRYTCRDHKKDAKTGLISYIKSTTDETGESVSYVHTLNSPSGFQRKLEAIQVVLSDEYLV